jgi:hypothetical protein
MNDQGLTKDKAIFIQLISDSVRDFHSNLDKSEFFRPGDDARFYE